ncbi:MAG: hypothetical protein IK125_06365 [Lachnospiraceae bacterium]|nr:hypothetical protein [Lachnospiraceae bacterium]
MIDLYKKFYPLKGDESARRIISENAVDIIKLIQNRTEQYHDRVNELNFLEVKALAYQQKGKQKKYDKLMAELKEKQERRKELDIVYRELNQYGDKMFNRKYKFSMADGNRLIELLDQTNPKSKNYRG